MKTVITYDFHKKILFISLNVEFTSTKKIHIYLKPLYFISIRKPKATKFLSRLSDRFNSL